MSNRQSGSKGGYYRSPPKCRLEAIARLDELKHKLDAIKVSQVWFDVVGQANIMSMAEGKKALDFWFQHLQGCLLYPRDYVNVLILRLRSHVSIGKPLETFPSFEILSEWEQARLTGLEIRKSFSERQADIWFNVNASLIDHDYRDDYNPPPKDDEGRCLFWKTFGKGLEDRVPDRGFSTPHPSTGKVFGMTKDISHRSGKRTSSHLNWEQTPQNVRVPDHGFSTPHHSTGKVYGMTKDTKHWQRSGKRTSSHLNWEQQSGFYRKQQMRNPPSPLLLPYGVYSDDSDTPMVYD